MSNQNQQELYHVYDSILQHLQEGILIADESGKVLRINHAFSVITGYSEKDVLGKDSKIIAAGQFMKEHQDICSQLVSTGSWKGDVWNQKKSGEICLQRVKILLLTNTTGKTFGYVGMFTDITEQRHLEEHMNHLYTHDPLTNLPNRHTFLVKLRSALVAQRETGKSTAVIYLGIDGFKYVNEFFGPASGDRVLQMIANRLKRSVRDQDKVARVGSDKYSILLNGIADEEVVLMASRIANIFTLPFRVNGQEIVITASFGITLSPADGKDPGSLLKNAEAAMVEAKKSGGDCYKFFQQEIHPKARRKLLLARTLRKALEEDQFKLLYQPQVDMQTNSVVGVETLIRWEHPDLGLISPSEFIPLAEETGIIVAIGDWILTNACKQCVTWLNEGYNPIRVAVNLSAKQLEQEDLAERISLILSETTLPSKYLELEITESVAMNNVEKVIETLTTLKKMGIKLSIDDFGTGYSSLSYLSRFPLDTLKIDQSFIKGITGEGRDADIVKAMILMASSLRLTVIAEGVESDAQAQLLRDLRCDEYQGYMFSEPVSPEKVVLLLRK